MERAEDLFDLLVRDGEAAIDALIADRQSEELFLDFKRSTDSGSSTKLHQADRQNLSKAISGFGNSEGGVVIWGVDCRDTTASGDVAQAKLPLENPKRFISWLEGAISGCTIPAHPHVKHHAIVRPHNDTGFVVTHIPKSFLAPHQCVSTPYYYMRSGSNFLPVPHAVLQGMFGRVQSPSLFHFWTVEKPQFFDDAGSMRQVSLRLAPMLSTHGPGLIEDIFLNLVWFTPEQLSRITPDFIEPQWTARTLFGSRVNLVSTSDFRLGPEAVTCPVVLDVILKPPFETDFFLELVYGHKNSPTYKIQFNTPREDIQAVFDAVARDKSLPIQDIYQRIFGIENPVVAKSLRQQSVF